MVQICGTSRGQDSQGMWQGIQYLTNYKDSLLSVVNADTTPRIKPLRQPFCHIHISFTTNPSSNHWSSNHQVRRALLTVNTHKALVRTEYRVKSYRPAPTS
ncbi:hypothetical protein XENORESO_005131 [Xenotaenia resolanae]|uniref:Uncharacterized protein n=1 Tax=Xenotaenia resolanae TaxID=208358 RepID=A0ABV0WPT4_9TELE